MIADTTNPGRGPLFSVLLPSRNRLDLLKSALDSVLKQDFESFEVIVSDNCSDEDYAHYIQYVGDPRVKLVRTEATCPVTDNWNHALRHASGQYIIMLGDDDALAPGSLRRLSQHVVFYDAPEVIYSMVYHYAYPNVVPHSPHGYFATVKPTPIYSGQAGPSFLEVSQARQFGRRALHFRHLFGFNSQFFVWNRDFIQSLDKYGPFFQSPYPDFYSSFVTMLKAERILVDPEPMAIVGISPKSFGFYFHRDRTQAGNEMLKLSVDDADAVRSLVPGAAGALDLPGSHHYRNWLLAALFVIRNLEPELKLTADLRRFRRLQLFEAAYQFYSNRRPERRTAPELRDALSDKERRLFDRLSWSFALMKRSPQISPPYVHDALFGLFQIYPPAHIEGHDIGQHTCIADAVGWLERKRQRPRALSRQMLGLRLRQLRSRTWYRNQWKKLRSRDWAKHQIDRLYNIIGERPPLYQPTAPPVPVEPPPREISSYERLQLDREHARRQLYRTGANPGLLSFMTAAYNTPPRYLALLAESVLGQDSEDVFEWVLLDNGSTDAQTRELIQRIARDPRVRYGRVEENIGIVRGMKWCCDYARGRYVLPLDSDDVISRDCARVVAAFLEMHGFPAILYTDEDKIEGWRRFQAYAKPDWDEVLFTHSCFIAHLTAFDREWAQRLGCYTDPAAEGSHDWDTFVRFLNAGHAPAHIPEMLYSWRVHPGSTSADYTTKPYVVESQRSVLRRFIEHRPTRYSYSVEYAPLFGGSPDWRYKPTDLPRRAPVVQIVDRGDPPGPAEQMAAVKVLGTSFSVRALRAALAHVEGGIEHVHLLDSQCRPTGELWLEEAVAMLDIYPQAVAVGGRIHDGARILSAGYVFGFGEPVTCPDKGRSLSDPGYFAQMWKPRTVAAVSQRHCVVRLEFLRRALAHMPDEVDWNLFGAWLGAFARRERKSVIYSPYVEAQAARDTDESISPEGKRQFIAYNGDLLDDRVGYSPGLCRIPGRAYECGVDDEPVARPSYSQWSLLQAHGQNGRDRTPAEISCSLFTSVYEKTSVQYFRELVGAIGKLSPRPLEWIVLAHGPISDELRSALEEIATRPSVKLSYFDRNLGITGASRYCLEQARGQWVMPVDADDLLVHDALGRVAQAIDAHPEARIFFSDEDVYLQGELKWPCNRPAFDPVLAGCQSYVAHAIVFHRETALKLGAYTDGSVEYCLDWDLISRFPPAGHEPVHIPQIIYRWRKHEASISQSGATFDGSVRAIRGMLERVRIDSAHPERYEVVDYPIDLGIPDSYLRRKPSDPPSVHAVLLGASPKRALWRGGPSLSHVSLLADPLDHDALSRLQEIVSEISDEYVLLLGAGVTPLQDDGLWDAIKLLELTSCLSAVGGPLVTLENCILRGALVVVPGNRLIDPLAGRCGAEPGAYSIAAKPHCVVAPSIDLMLAGRDDLRAALASAPEKTSMRNLGLWIGLDAAQRGRRVAFDPLFGGQVVAPERLVGDPIEGLSRAWEWLSAEAGPRRWPRMGLAGFKYAELFHH